MDIADSVKKNFAKIFSTPSMKILTDAKKN